MYIDKADPSEVQEGTYFPRIAAQLRAGVPAPRIRDQLINDFELSRLAAGKLVEDVQKGIRIARMNLVAGAGVWLIGFMLLMVAGSGLLSWGLVVTGTVQLAAGYRTMRAYRAAVYEEAA